MPKPESHGGLDAAKDRLMGQPEVSFDMQKVLIDNKAKREQQKDIRARAQEKLEQDLARARVRGSRKRIQELETERLVQKQEESHELTVLRSALDEEKVRLKTELGKHDERKTG
jgi:hypothetical protein